MVTEARALKCLTFLFGLFGSFCFFGDRFICFVCLLFWLGQFFLFAFVSWV